MLYCSCHKKQFIRRLKDGLLLAFLSFGIIIFFGFIIFTQEAKGSRIALTPLIFELTGQRGERVVEHIRVMNPSYDDVITIEMEIEDIFPSGEEGRIRLEIPPEERDPFSLSSWITIEPEIFILQPREEKSVKFTINTPEYAEPGGHYAGILARTRTVDGPAGVGVGIVTRIASLVLLTVPGEMEEELSLTSLETSKIYNEFGPIDFIVRFENTGNVHLRPQTAITVTNFLGQRVAEIPVETRNVLPDAVRRLEAQWDQKWIWGGKYTATLTGTYGRTNIPLSPETIVFWAFPWKVGGGILLILALVLIFLIATRKRWGTALRILFKGEAGMPKEKIEQKPKPGSGAGL